MKSQELEEKNQELMDSIYYAKRIQTAILPSIDYINKFLPNFFVFYKPKDILSGDCYWFSQFGRQSVLANIDCTGHGVPGAIMSVIAHNLLNQVIINELLFEPDLILKQLDLKLRDILNQENESEYQVKDGMDIAILVLDHIDKKVTIASANRPIYLFRAQEIHEFTGTKLPIGDYLFDVGEKTFHRHELELQDGDRLYVFTDGIVDQFGGEKGKRYTSKRLKEFLLQIQPKPIEEHVFVLSEEFENWKRDHPQTDDICFIGLQPF